MLRLWARRGGKEPNMRKTIIAVSAIAWLGYGATSASAGGSVVVNQTNHISNATQTFKDVDPCTGAPARITIHFSGVQHLVVQSDGVGHFTETSVGWFSLDLLPADGVADATGHFVSWDGGNGLFDNHGNPIGRAEQSFTLNGG